MQRTTTTQLFKDVGIGDIRIRITVEHIVNIVNVLALSSGYNVIKSLICRVRRELRAAKTDTRRFPHEMHCPLHLRSAPEFAFRKART